MPQATLKSTQDGEGYDALISLGLPNGKKYELKFNRGTNWTQVVPIPLTFVDDFDKTVVVQPNWPEHLLNVRNAKGELAYPYLTLVDVKEDPIVNAPIVKVPKKQPPPEAAVDAEASEEDPKKPRGRPRKVRTETEGETQ